MKRIKKIVSCLLFMAIFCFTITNPAYAATDSDQSAVIDLTNRFFAAKNSYYQDGTDTQNLSRLDILDFYNSRFSGMFKEHNYSIDFFLNRIAFFNESYRVRQKQIVNYTYSINIDSIQWKSDIATVKVTEHVLYQEGDSPLNSGWNNTYTLTISNNGAWQIQRIYSAEGFYTRYYNESSSLPASLQLDSAFASLYEDNAQTGLPLTEQSQTILDTNASIAYAQAYALNYNSAFPSYAGKGGDCANFGSQCIYVGLGGNPLNPNDKSAPMVDWGLANPRSWYHGSAKLDTGTAWTWTSTSRFYGHVIAGSPVLPGLYGIEIDISQAQPGDIVHVDFQSNGEYDHTVFVTGVDQIGKTNSLSQISTSGHTNDRLNYPLDQFGYGATYRAIRILGNIETIPGEWLQNEYGWWYQHTDSSFSLNSWEKINGVWYRFDEYGYMHTGWLQDGESWYYLDTEDGHMYTGEHEIDGVLYLFDGSGIWLPQVQ